MGIFESLMIIGVALGIFSAGAKTGQYLEQEKCAQRAVVDSNDRNTGKIRRGVPLRPPQPRLKEVRQINEDGSQDILYQDGNSN